MRYLPLREQARYQSMSTYGFPRTAREWELNKHRQQLAYFDAFSYLHEVRVSWRMDVEGVKLWLMFDGFTKDAYTLGMGLGPYGA